MGAGAGEELLVSTKQTPPLHTKPSTQSAFEVQVRKQRLSLNLSTRSQVSFAPHCVLTQLEVQMPFLPCGLSLSVMQIAPAHSLPEPVAPEHSPLFTLRPPETEALFVPLPREVPVPCDVLEHASRLVATEAKTKTPRHPPWMFMGVTLGDALHSAIHPLG